MSPEQFNQVWEDYRYNFMRYLTAITRHSERQAMERLTERGHPRLAMSFSAPMSLLAAKPLRLTELAEALGVSKQLCLQSLKPIEQAGYIARRADPADKRAKLVALTASGERMIEDALEEMQALHRHYESLIGPEALQSLSTSLRHASKAIAVPGEGIRAGRGLPVSARLTPLSRVLQERLMAITARQGHKLQFSFGQVLSAIDLRGTPVAALAQLNGVTTQAISRIAGELETLGYIRRTTSQNDRRSRQLCFTPKGLALIRDSVRSVQTLADELIADMGAEDFRTMEAMTRQLYLALDLEHDMLGEFAPSLAAELLDGMDESADPQPDFAAILLYLAQQLDDSLVEQRGEQRHLTDATRAIQSADALKSIERRLTMQERRKLDELLTTLRGS